MVAILPTIFRLHRPNVAIFAFALWTVANDLLQLPPWHRLPKRALELVISPQNGFPTRQISLTLNAVFVGRIDDQQFRHSFVAPLSLHKDRCDLYPMWCGELCAGGAVVLLGRRVTQVGSFVVFRANFEVSPVFRSSQSFSKHCNFFLFPSIL